MPPEKHKEGEDEICVEILERRVTQILKDTIIYLFIHDALSGRPV